MSIFIRHVRSIVWCLLCLFPGTQSLYASEDIRLITAESELFYHSADGIRIPLHRLPKIVVDDRRTSNPTEQDQKELVKNSMPAYINRLGTIFTRGDFLLGYRTSISREEFGDKINELFALDVYDVAPVYRINNMDTVIAGLIFDMYGDASIARVHEILAHFIDTDYIGTITKNGSEFLIDFKNLYFFKNTDPSLDIVRLANLLHERGKDNDPRLVDLKHARPFFRHLQSEVLVDVSVTPQSATIGHLARSVVLHIRIFDPKVDIIDPVPQFFKGTSSFVSEDMKGIEPQNGFFDSKVDPINPKVEYTQDGIRHIVYTWRMDHLDSGSHTWKIDSVEVQYNDASGKQQSAYSDKIFYYVSPLLGEFTIDDIPSPHKIDISDVVVPTVAREVPLFPYPHIAGFFIEADTELETYTDARTQLIWAIWFIALMLVTVMLWPISKALSARFNVTDRHIVRRFADTDFQRLKNDAMDASEDSDSKEFVQISWRILSGTLREAFPRLNKRRGLITFSNLREEGVFNDTPVLSASVEEIYSVLNDEESSENNPLADKAKRKYVLRLLEEVYRTLH